MPDGRHDGRTESRRQGFAIETLITSQCLKLGLSKAELVRLAGYKNETKGLRRLAALLAGDLVRTGSLIQGLPAALNLSTDTISRALEQTRQQIAAVEPRGTEQTKAKRPATGEPPKQQLGRHQSELKSDHVLIDRAMAYLASRRRETRAIITAQSTEAIRLVHIRIRRCRRSLLKVALKARVVALMRLFRAQQTAARMTGRALAYAGRWSATIVAILISLLFIVFVQDTEHLRTSEVELACAQMIGAALALLLSLSIIPAQRAAEAFSPAILQLYAQDRWLLGAFLTLVATTSASVLLGTNFIPKMDARISIGIQFLLLGISLDALRGYYRRILDLLNPQTAFHLVVRKCAGLVNHVGRIVQRLTRIQGLASGTGEITDASRAIYFSASQVSHALRFWIAQLDEIAHKLIPRRDTSAVNAIVTGMSNIGTQYSETRRNSVLLIPDFDNLFAGGISDISDVLNPIYERIRVICEDAAKSSNELVVKHCIDALVKMTTHAMTIVHSSDGGLRKAPLAFSPCFWHGLCTTTALKYAMDDAALTAVNGFQSILLNQKKDLYTSELEAQSLESLSTLALASYLKNDAVWGFPAIKAMLIASRHDIDLHGYHDTPTLTTVLRYARSYIPFEVAMDKAGKRTQQTFPLCDLGFRCSVPALLEVVAHQVKREQDRWQNPFDEFLKAAADVRDFYRELSRTDFENRLLRKWIVDSLLATVKSFSFGAATPRRHRRSC